MARFWDDIVAEELSSVAASVLEEGRAEQAALAKKAQPQVLKFDLRLAPCFPALFSRPFPVLLVVLCRNRARCTCRSPSQRARAASHQRSSPPFSEHVVPPDGLLWLHWQRIIPQHRRRSYFSRRFHEAGGGGAGARRLITCVYARGIISREIP